MFMIIEKAFIIILLIIITHEQEPRPITIDIEYDTSKLYIKAHSLQVNTLSYVMTSVIDINSYTTWIKGEHIQSLDKLENPSPAAGRYGQCAIYGMITRTQINFNGDNCDSFPLVIISHMKGPPPIETTSIIGIGLQSYMMSYLRKSRNTLGLFTMSFTNSTHGSIVLGEIPSIANQAPHLLATCKVSDDIMNDEWGCPLQYIIIGKAGKMTLSTKNPNENHINISYKKSIIHKVPEMISTVFASIEGFILCPEAFIPFLHQYYFKTVIDSGICTYEAIDNHLYFVCIEQALEELDALKFVIGNYQFMFNPSELFINLQSVYVFMIRINDIDDNQWVLGNVFLKRYTTIFNSDDRTVGFFSKDPKILVQVTNDDIIEDKANPNDERNNLYALFIKMEIALCCFALFYMILIKLYQSQITSLLNNSLSVDKDSILNLLN